MSKFIPRVGTLYAVTKVSASGTEVAYCLPYNETNLSAFREICRMIDYVVYPRHTEFTQKNLEIDQKSGDIHCPVHQYWRECTHEDLRAIGRLWQKQNAVLGVEYVSFAEWHASIMSNDSIPQEVKHDLWKVYR